MELNSKALVIANKLSKYCLDNFNRAYKENEKMLPLVFPVTAEISVSFSINNDLTLAQFQYKGYTNPAVTLPAIDNDKRFNLYKFISKCLVVVEDYCNTHVHTDSPMGVPFIALALSSWLKAYEKGYTYANFKKAVYNNLDCAYSYSLSNNINEASNVSEIRVYNTCLTYRNKDKQLHFYLNFRNDAITGGVGIDLVQEFFYRRYDMDTLLTTFAPYVPEVTLYFRNKNIASIFKHI